MKAKAWKCVRSIAVGAMLAGCTGPPRPFPVHGGDDRRVAPEAVDAALQDQRSDMDKAIASLAGRARSAEPLNILVLSSGGQSGAFGAGLIEGWGSAGARPDFDVVTGTSTGALIAVFAFLGAEGDATLRGMYTSHATSDVYTPYPWVSVLTSSAYAASTPMRTTIAKYVTDDVVRAVGREAARGRVLLISTANLDLNVMRIWNLTALAADETRPLSERAQRFRQILMASLSIPGLVPPVFLDGCMHVDGGVVRQLFVVDGEHAGDMARVLAPEGVPGPNVWVVVNRRIGTSPRVIRNQIIPIASRSIQMIVDSVLVRDIDEAQRFTTLLKGRFFLASLPVDPARRLPEGFLDPEYMKQIHALGFRLGATSEAWVGDPLTPRAERNAPQVAPRP